MIATVVSIALQLSLVLLLSPLVSGIIKTPDGAELRFAQLR